MFVKDGQLNFVYNFLGIAPEQRLDCIAPAPGKHVVGVDFAKTSVSDKLEVLGTMTLHVDDAAVASADFRIQSGHYALAGEGLAVGRDSADPVSTEYGPRSRSRVAASSRRPYNVGDDAYIDLDLRLDAIPDATDCEVRSNVSTALRSQMLKGTATPALTVVRSSSGR